MTMTTGPVVKTNQVLEDIREALRDLYTPDVFIAVETVAEGPAWLRLRHVLGVHSRKIHDYDDETHTLVRMASADVGYFIQETPQEFLNKVSDAVQRAKERG